MSDGRLGGLNMFFEGFSDGMIRPKRPSMRVWATKPCVSDISRSKTET